MNKSMQLLSFYTSSKLIQNSMNECMTLEYSNKEIIYEFDENKNIFIYAYSIL